jgi:RHS repeat-associated protein
MYSHDAYSNAAASTGPVANSLLYAGAYLNNESGCYYLRARYYDPATAQFLTRDRWSPRRNRGIIMPVGSGVDRVD